VPVLGWRFKARARAFSACTNPEPEPQHPEPSARTGSSPARELVATYCVSCHNPKLKTGNFVLDPTAADNVAGSPETWEKVVVKLRSRAMPPLRSRRPDNKTYDAVVTWLETELDRTAAANPKPGRPADLHRLNRAEYANAVRDLLGVQVDGTLMLPPDEQAHGFDTNADALSVVPALLDRYLTAAAKISRLAIGDPTLRPAFERYTAVRNNSNERTWLWQTERLGEEFPLGSRGGIAARHYFPVDGEYVLKARLDKTYTGMVRGLNVPNEIEFRVDGKRVGQVTLGGPELTAASARTSAPEAEAGNPLFTADDGLEVRVPLKAGLHDVTCNGREGRWRKARGSRSRPHPNLGARLRRRHPRAARVCGAARRRPVRRPDARGVAEPPPHLCVRPTFARRASAGSRRSLGGGGRISRRNRLRHEDSLEPRAPRVPPFGDDGRRADADGFL
jgi:mono/diheme cytochrome c family protein